MRKALSLVVVASLVAVSMSASADGTVEAPWMRDTPRDDGQSKATVMCWSLPATGSRPRVTCAVAESEIMPPDVANVARGTEALSGASDAYALSVCPSTPFAASRPEVDAHDRAILEAVDRACAAHDGAAAKRALVSMMQEIGAVSCTLATTQWNELEIFEQVDVNTWVETKAPRGVCRQSSTLTLTRKAANASWELSVVNTMPSPAPSPMCKVTPSHRWTVGHRSFSRTGCKYVG